MKNIEQLTGSQEVVGSNPIFSKDGGTTEVIDFSPLFDDVIENYLSSGSLSKTFQVGNLRIQSEIQDYYGNLEGVIRFYVYEV